MTDGSSATMTSDTATTSQMQANVYKTAGGDEYVIEIPLPGLEQSEIFH
jgi:HSP20 family molecular chaperone IbpA